MAINPEAIPETEFRSINISDSDLPFVTFQLSFLKKTGLLLTRIGGALVRPGPVCDLKRLQRITANPSLG